MSTKLTAEMIEEQEANALIEAIGNEIELNDAFLKKYCSKEFKELMDKIPYSDRGYVLDGIDETHVWNGGPASTNNDIVLDTAEIEYQFEGKPEDVFENINDFTFNDNRAYLYTGYGLSVNYDRQQLLEAIEQYLDDHRKGQTMTCPFCSNGNLLIVEKQWLFESSSQKITPVIGHAILCLDCGLRGPIAYEQGAPMTGEALDKMAWEFFNDLTIKEKK